VSPPVIGAIIGTAIGAAQIFNLQQYLTRSGWGWVLTSTIGWAISWTTINQYVGYFVLGLGITQFSLVRGLAAGALAGLGQWLIYRQQFNRAGWWIPANAVGWGAGMAVGVAVGGAFGWPLVGAVAGAMTGYPLVWMLKPRAPTTSNGVDTV